MIDKEFILGLVSISCFFVISLLVFFASIFFVAKLGHENEIEQINLLRCSYEDTLVGSEQLLPMVVRANQTILSYQRDNQNWLFDMFVDDQWDSVDLIRVKKIHLGSVK